MTMRIFKLKDLRFINLYRNLYIVKKPAAKDLRYWRLYVRKRQNVCDRNDERRLHPNSFSYSTIPF